MGSNEILILGLIAIVGASFGSFITAASWRLPRNEDIIFDASKCPKCNTKLGFFDLFPVFSWLFSRGKCRHCKAPVSARYVLTELITAAMFLFLYIKFGWGGQFIILSLLSVALLVLIISDFETYIIPDSTTVGSLVLALVYHYLYTDMAHWPSFLIGGATGLLVALGMRYGYYIVTKREGLGFGDVKFLPVAGLWIGWEAMPVYFILSGIMGIVTGVLWKIFFKNPEYPFGPALAMAMFLLVIYPELNLLLLQPK